MVGCQNKVVAKKQVLEREVQTYTLVTDNQALQQPAATNKRIKVVAATDFDEKW